MLRMAALSGELICVLYTLKDGGWAIVTPEGYFDCDGSTTTLNAMTLIDKTTGALLNADYAVRFWNPDMVRKHLSK